jgi:protein TonB
VPKLGAFVRSQSEPGGRRANATSGSAVGTEGKPKEKGQITEESGGGVHLSSISSPEFQHQTWYDSVRRKIELVWVYPLEAAQAGIQGEVTIDFVIERNGSVSSIRLVKSSGYKVLDDEAIRAIQVVGRARFNPIPKSYNIPSLSIRGRFMYIQGGDRSFR